MLAWDIHRYTFYVVTTISRPTTPYCSLFNIARGKSAVFIPTILIVACYPDYNTHYRQNRPKNHSKDKIIMFIGRFIVCTWLPYNFILSELLIKKIVYDRRAKYSCNKVIEMLSFITRFQIKQSKVSDKIFKLQWSFNLHSEKKNRRVIFALRILWNCDRG